MPDLILHHYPQSPVAEKVRKVLGLKGLSWHSVEIPRLPPKPDLMPLTGGYRLTPVLQIGANVYCDSACIIREIDRLHPSTGLTPVSYRHMAWIIGRWVETDMFASAVAVVLGAQAATLPPEFAADRGRLYFGPDYDYEAMHRNLPNELAQIRTQFGWLEEHLGSDAQYMLGDVPGLADAMVYYVAWFLRGRYEHGPALIDAFPTLAAWEARVKALGHGQWTNLDSRTALEIACSAQAEPMDDVDPAKGQSLVAGQRVAVSSIADDGTTPVTGSLTTLTHDTIAIRREAPEVGEVVVNFPRLGYRVGAA